MRAILTWHSIDASGSPISVAPEAFRQQVDWLRSGRVRVVSVDELLTMPRDVDAVALTFDDGFANFATEAAPLLLRDDFPVTVFVVTDRVGMDNRWRGQDEGMPVLPLMDWDTLGRLQQQRVTIGAHTRTHPRLTSAGTDVMAELRGADDSLERELARVRQALPIPTVPAMRASRAPSRRHIGGRAPRHFDRSPMLTIPICCPGLMRGTSVIIAGSIRGGLRDSGLGRGPAKMGAQFGMP